MYLINWQLVVWPSVLFFSPPNHQTHTSLGMDTGDAFYIFVAIFLQLGNRFDSLPPSNFLLSGSPLMMSWKTRTSAPIVVLDWLILSACKSRRWGPGVHWPNYAKHITHLERWRLGRMKWKREGKKQDGEREKKEKRNAALERVASGQGVENGK